MIRRTLNRFGGRVSERLPAFPPAPVASAVTVYARRCTSCSQPKAIAGGKSRWAYRRGVRVSLFTCAGCL